MPVEQNRARAANAMFATQMRPGQLQLLAQEVREMLACLYAPLQRFSVQNCFDLYLFAADEIRRAHAAALSDKLLSTRRVLVVQRLEPIWNEREKWAKHPKKVEAVVAAGTEKAEKVARATLEEAREAMKI